MKEVRLEDIRALPQRLRPAQRLALDLAISATLALTLVAWASTVPLTYSVFKGMRNMVLMPSIIFCFLFLLPKIRSRLFLLGACLWLLLVLYAFLLSNLTHSASLTSSTEVLLFFVIVVIFFFFLSLSKDEVISDRAMTIIFFFILGVFIFTANAQGFLWGTPPVFVFSAETFGSESNLSYSLGASRFYGLGAVTAAIMWGKQKKPMLRAAFLIGSLFMLGLCLIGGGRGEAIITALIMLFRVGAIRIIFIVLPLISLISLFVGTSQFITQGYLPIIQRFTFLAYSAGQRDILLLQAIDLLSSELRCFIMGCGYSYFQQYYKLSYGLYPHNIIAEFIIVFGFPIFVTMSGLAIVGARKVFANGANRNYMLLLLYFFLIGLKSGTLTQAWFAVGGLLHLSMIGLVELIRSYPYGSRQ